MSGITGRGGMPELEVVRGLGRHYLLRYADLLARGFFFFHILDLAFAGR